jgi:chromosome segregation ATPase
MDLKIKTKLQINALILFTLIALSIIEAIALVVQYIDFQQRLAVSEKEKINLKTELEELRTKLLSQEELYNKEKEASNLELNELKLILSQTEESLNRFRNEKRVLEGETERINGELILLKENARLLEGKINNLGEIKLFLDVKIKALKELRQRIKNFKKQALLNKIRVQRELDRIKLELGNRGFVIKEGESTVDTKRAVELEKIIIKHSSIQK